MSQIQLVGKELFGKMILKKRFKLFDNKSIRAGLWYTVGNYLLKGMSIITVPLFARIMTKADYGIYNTFLSYESIVYIFISLALHSSLKNAKYEYNDDFDYYVSSITILPILLIIVFGGCVTIFRGFFTQLLGLQYKELLLLGIYSYTSGLLLLYRSKLALNYEYKEYMGLSYFNALSTLALSLLFVVTIFNDQKYTGRIIGSLIPLMLISVYILTKLYRKAKPTWNTNFYRYGLKISIPIIPHGLAQIILMSFDRIMISRIIGEEAAGVYSFAYTLYTIISITGSSISTVYEPWAYEKLNQGEYGLLKNRSSQIVALFAVISSAVILFSPEIIYILGSETYHDAIYSVIPIVAAGFFSMSYTIPSVIEYYSKKTNYIAMGTMAAAGINIGLNAIFIPIYGYVAAAYTTLFSYVAYFVFHSVISYRIEKKYILDWKILLGSIILLTSMSIVGMAFRGHFLCRFVIALILGIITITSVAYVRKSNSAK